MPEISRLKRVCYGTMTTGWWRLATAARPISQAGGSEDGRLAGRQGDHVFYQRGRDERLQLHGGGFRAADSERMEYGVSLDGRWETR